MISLLYFTDLHLQVKAPSSRVDDYCEAVITKVDEIIEIAKERCVPKPRLLCGGDLFNTVNPGLKAFGELAIRLREIDIAGVLGSHDYFGYQLKSIKDTAAGYMRVLGGFHLLDATGVRYVEDETGMVVRVVGFCHEAGQSAETLSVQKQSPNERIIQIIHGDLMDKLVVWDHILIQDIQTEAEVVLAGHYHNGWGPIVHNGTTFIHPGSIARTDQSERDIIPSVLLIEIEHGAPMRLTKIPLKSARPATEVFRNIETGEIKTVSLDAFTQSVQGLTMAPGMSLVEAITQVGSESPETVALLLNLLRARNG